MKIPEDYRLYDTAEYLDDDEMIVEYLKATCEDGTPNEIARALGVIARAQNMTKLAEKTGLSRQALYKALSGEGNPEFATIMKVAEALGLRVTFVNAEGKAPDSEGKAQDAA